MLMRSFEGCSSMPDMPFFDEDRVNELSAKARAGTLTESESQELDSCLHVGSVLAVLQSKRRRLLKQVGDALQIDGISRRTGERCSP
jgi:hypothetical protein